MFEGNNEVVFSKETTKKLFSRLMSNLFNQPIEVTDLSMDYKGVSVNFTEIIPLKKEEEKENENIKTDGE